MSSSFSNTDTGNKPADPYTEANKDETPPSLQEKVEALAKFIASCKFGMMTTHDATSDKLVSRAMAVAATESGGLDLLFFTNTESHKTDDLHGDPHVNISFLDSSSTGQWASLAGTASIETDRNLVHQHYTPALRAWLGDLGDGTHDGSADDPRIAVIRVQAASVTYALTDQTLLARVAGIAKAAATGNVATPNKLREISEVEVLQWRAVAH